MLNSWDRPVIGKALFVVCLNKVMMTSFYRQRNAAFIPLTLSEVDLNIGTIWSMGSLIIKPFSYKKLILLGPLGAG